VSRNGVLRGLDAHAARAGDRLVVFLPDAGFAVVETSDPRAYRRFGDVVVRDVVVQWQEPTTTVAFEADVGDPPFSGRPTSSSTCSGGTCRSARPPPGRRTCAARACAWPSSTAAST
jgi:hypothetical protein